MDDFVEADMTLDEVMYSLEKSEKDPRLDWMTLQSMGVCAEQYLSEDRKNPGLIILRLLHYVRYLENKIVG